MDQQGSTPDITAGGITPSLPSSADNAGVPQSTQPSQPVAPAPAQNGDLLGNLQLKAEQGESDTGTSAETPPSNGDPSQSTPDNTTPQAQPENQGQPQAGDSVEDDLKKWASSQNIDLDNPTPEQARKLAQRLRDTQKWAHERATNNQQFDQIQQQLNSDEFEDPLEKEIRQLRASNARRDFWDSHPEDRTLEGAMIQKVQEMVDSGNTAGAQYYSTPQGWADLLQIVKTSQGTKTPDALYEAGRQDERANLAKVQQAAPPAAAATSSAPPAPVDEDAMIANMSDAEYAEWRKSHNPFAVR